MPGPATRQTRGRGSSTLARVGTQLHTNADQLAALAKQVDADDLHVEVAATYPLSRTATVHELSAAGRIRGKVLLTPADWSSSLTPRPGSRGHDARMERKMTDAASINARTIAEFRANHGQVGGGFAGAPLLLLHTVGVRSGIPRINPMMYLPDGRRYLVFASKAGSDRNPDWYHNLLAHSDARIEVGEQTLTVRAEELHGAERDDFFAEQARRHPGFAAYQRQTDRTIPVIALTPTSGPATPPVSGPS